MTSVAYDTSWLVRAIRQFPGNGFEESLSWLRRAQHTDGSWGGDILHYHDRIVCTLAAIIALSRHGDLADQKRIRQGQKYLWREQGKLHYDADETIAFPLLFTILSAEANLLSLDVPNTPLPNLHIINKKLDALRSAPQHWRHSTITYSFEALSSHLTPGSYDFLEKNFSVATSPAASISLLLNAAEFIPQATVDYVQNVFNEQGDGGLPTLAPFEVFEIIWVLHFLRRANAVTPDQPSVRRLLDYLWKVWSPQNGLSLSYYYTVTDLDETAVGFSLLRWGGYPVNADIFSSFEAEDHFECYPGEADPSWNTHIHLLTTLKYETDHPQYENWKQKILKVLRRNRRGGYWFDKWHISPYYPTSDSISTMLIFDKKLAEDNIRWILNTQREDGGWGYYGQSTAEETAFCLLALVNWERECGPVDKDILTSAHAYLSAHVDDSHIPMQWIGKCLYTPDRIVRASELAALSAYSQREMK